jgi:regulator of protease activity HflC (stomatin/prohibitin superfamily)
MQAVVQQKQELHRRTRENQVMFGFRKVIVHKNERGFLFKEGDFIKALEPGIHRYFDPFGKIKVELYNLSTPEFSHPLTDFLLKTQPQVIAEYFTVVTLNAQQVALIYKNGQLADILPPNTRALYWQGVVEIVSEIFDISANYTIAWEKATLLIHTKNSYLLQRVQQAIYYKEVSQYQMGVLYVNGQCLTTLSPGLHAYWHFNRSLNITVWEMRLQELEVAGQEILTKDKVNLRLNLAANYLLKDVLLAISTTDNPKLYLYKELQFGLRAAVGTRTLDELLENKDAIDEMVSTHVKGKMAAIGIEVQSVGVKDIILPGEMKAILSKVVEAEKMAQANLIKRREETAATRSLLNTAKVMEDNPTALRLKELEMLEKVTEKIGNISVYGGLDGLLKELVKIR